MTEPHYQIYSKMHLEARSETKDTQSLICMPSDLNSVQYIKFEGEEKYFVDVACSPVVEFSRSGYDAESNTLVSGRLWYEHKCWTKDEDGNDILVEKSKELEKLYNSLARWIRKYCTRLPNGNYIGPHAMELYRKGAKL
jgi:hypothetical protein